MKILAIADRPSEYLWGSGVHAALRDVDLILSCGDLDPRYLSFLVTFTHAPLLYVHGNHDDCYARTPPDGCVCIDGKLITCQGLRVLGLGGSVRYNRDSQHQYTQRQMARRVANLWLTLHWNHGFDILLTHSGAFGLGDGGDHAHVGFHVFNTLLDRWKPSFFIHGHSHLNYDIRQKRVSSYRQTQVINAYERHVFEVQSEL